MVQKTLFTEGPYRIGLIGCGDEKLDHAAPAKDLYTSSFFRLKRKYVESTCDEWFIVSAKHGLVHPETIIEPYNKKLGSSRGEIAVFRHGLQADFCDVIRQEWIRQEIPYGAKQLIPGLVELVTIAGKSYREAIKDTAMGRVYHTNPVDGLDLFGQMKWLKEACE